MMRRLALAAIAAHWVLSAPAAANPTVAVTEIVAEPECRILESCWGWWMMIECRNNFAPMRMRLESALHESRRFTAAGRGGGELVATGRVTELGLQHSTATGRDYQLSSSRAVATLDLVIQERGSNRTIYAGTVRASVDAGTDIAADGQSFTGEANSRAVYAELQRELALAASRSAAFAVDPLRVVAVDGRAIRLNYGAPLIAVDDAVQVAGDDGVPVHYRVTAVLPETAVAQAQVAAPVSVGAPASVPQEGRGTNRFPRVELPR
jgi:hypothetical protein